MLQDWLKLKMIRSSIPVLVDSALRDLDPQQLVLFIQSFGIPVDSMTKLLQTLDTAVTADLEAVRLMIVINIINETQGTLPGAPPLFPVGSHLGS